LANFSNIVVIKHNALAYVFNRDDTNFILQQISSVPVSLILILDFFFTRIVLKMLSLAM